MIFNDIYIYLLWFIIMIIVISLCFIVHNHIVNPHHQPSPSTKSTNPPRTLCPVTTRAAMVLRYNLLLSRLPVFELLAAGRPPVGLNPIHQHRPTIFAATHQVWHFREECLVFTSPLKLPTLAMCRKKHPTKMDIYIYTYIR